MEKIVKVRNRISNLSSLEQLNDSLLKGNVITFLNGNEQIEAIVTFLKKKEDFVWNIALKVLSNNREFSHLEAGNFFLGYYNAKTKAGVLLSTVP